MSGGRSLGSLAAIMTFHIGHPSTLYRFPSGRGQSPTGSALLVPFTRWGGLQMGVPYVTPEIGFPGQISAGF